MTVHEDILGAGYTAETLELRDGDVATLIHHPPSTPTRGAVLYVHGFADYFFQAHLADFFTDRGWDFHALDLRRYGRSLRPDDVKFFTTDLAEYAEELDLAIERIRADGHDRIIAMGHSTGGLILPLWLDTRPDSTVDGLILNSPWLDLQKNWFLRTIGTWVIDWSGWRKPMEQLPEKLTDIYPKSLHRDFHGEWTFNTDWKPVEPELLRAGWFRAIRRGHARLHAGLDLPMPILMLHSDKSRLGLDEWSPEAMTADTVLDVRQMDQWAAQVGPNLTTTVIPGAVHDVFLSAEPVRNHAFAEMDAWLENALASG